MPVTEKIAGITEKIVERSRPSRQRYLDRIEKAREAAPRRARLGCANLASEVGGMTGTLTIRYRSPTPVGEELRLEGWVERIEGRKIFARGTIHHGETLTAEAEGVFIQGSMQRFIESFGAAK